MKIPTINELLRSRLLIAGLVFISVNIGYSYKFYQVNSFKILMVLIGVSVLAIWNDLFFPENSDSRFPWKQTLIVTLPLFATLPGIICHQGDYNYNFRYELASNLILFIWFIYLYRGTEKQEDLNPFFFFIGIVVIYVGLWAFLERVGLHPYYWGEPVSRVKSTFGNINYFAGFLVVLTPFLLTLFLPNSLKDLLSRKTLFPSSNRAPVFYLVAFLIAVTCLILTQTRAAQGATVVSLAVVIFFYVYAFIPADYKKMTLYAGIICVVTGVLAVILLFSIREYLPETRYTKLLFLEGWTPRFAGWIPAIDSIKASPLIGFGLGSSYNLYFYFTDPDTRLFHAERSYNHVHSEILEYTQEAGIIGFVVYLLFWSYIAFLLFKTISSKKSDPLVKKIAVGIIGGFIGYHLQGAFSVAPRMMVVKLPLFTLIALTFILAKLTFEQRAFETNKNLLARGKSLMPSLIVLVFVWIMFRPWLIGQYGFTELRSSRPSLSQVEKLERLVKKYPDAYALDHLSSLQIRYKRTKQLQETVNIIDQILPHYRDLGYTKAILALINNEVLKGKKAALEFQNNRDRYHEPTILLLMGIAIDSNDYELFKTQIELYVRRLVFNLRLYYSLSASDVRIEFGSLDLPFEFTELPNGMQITWNENLIQSIFNAGRLVRTRSGYSPNDRDNLIRFLSFQFSRHNYFKLSLKDQYQDQGFKEVNQHLKSYFAVEKSIGKKSKEISEKQNKILFRTKPNERRGLQRKQGEERQELLKPLQDQLKIHREFLLERTNWEAYMKRRSFANKFIEDIVKIVFPRMKPN